MLYQRYINDYRLVNFPALIETLHILVRITINSKTRMECFPLFEIVEILDIINAYPLYAGIVLSWFFVRFYYVDNRQQFREDHALFSNKIKLQSKTLLIKIDIRINSVITWLFKAVKKYERDGDDDSTNPSIIYI